MLEIHKGGVLAIGSVLGDTHLWIRGRTTRVDRIAGMAVPRSLQHTAQWIDIGKDTIDFSPSLFVRPKRSLRPGDAQPDIVGPIAAIDDRAPVLARGAQLRRACGAPADWIDVIR
jgi:hypothetical protein